MDLPVLIEQCNVGAPQAVVEALIEVESRRVIHALNVNVPKGQPRPAYIEPTNVTESAAVAVDMLSQGYSVDVGLMQVNSKNLARFGIPIGQAYEPCTNIRAGTQVYIEFAARVSGMTEAFPTDLARLQGTISSYNTGSPWRGFKNGYVERVMHYLKFGVDPASAPMAVDFDLADSSEALDYGEAFNTGDVWPSVESLGDRGFSTETMNESIE